jgi:hypothetical protein
MPEGRKAPLESSERYAQRQVVTFLRKVGWFVQVASGASKAVPGLAGIPDLFCTRQRADGNAVILFVECKALGGKLRPSQEKWKKRAAPLLDCRNVYSTIAEATKEKEFLRQYFILALQNGFDPDEVDRWV